MTVEGERVLVVPRDIVLECNGWRGVRHGGLRQVRDAIDGHGRYLPRADVEVDPGWKQIIPYLVLRDGERWFLMRRTRAGGDARLHDLYSIGVGGHINPDDGGLEGGLRREWAEELVADFDPEPVLLGLLNDDTTAVGRVHLGVVFVADAAGRRVEIRETHKLSGSFVPFAEVRAAYPAMEAWSQLVVDAITREVSRPLG